MDVRARLQDAAWSVQGSEDLPDRARRRYVRRRVQRVSTGAASLAAGVAVLVGVLGIGPLDRSQPTAAGKPVAVEHIDDAYFVDSLHAVSVARGADPLVAATDDGGRTWTSVGQLDTDNGVGRGREVVFLNEHDGLVWGDGELFTTDDGGESWHAVDGTFLTIGASRVDQSVWSLTGCRTDVDDCNPGVARSTDGGESWTPTKETPKLRGGEHQLVGISQQVAYVLDGIAGAKAAVWRTDDGGASWRRSDAACLGDVVGRSSGPIRAVLWQVCPNVPGNTPQPTIAFRSFDGGQTWAPAGGRSGEEAPSGVIADFKALSDQLAVVALDGGAIYSTIDGGASWQHTFDLPAGSHPLLGVRAGMQVWAFTTASSPVHGLWMSRDGVDWARVDTGETLAPSVVGALPPTGVRGYSMSFVDEQTGVLFANDKVWRTSDGGRVWRAVGPAPDGLTLDFVDAEHGVTAIEDSEVNGVRVTADGGATWRLVDIEAPEPYSLLRGGDSLWMQGLCEPSCIARSDDGGQSWQKFPNGGEDLVPVDGLHAFQWRGEPSERRLQVTDDGGATFTDVAGPGGAGPCAERSWEMVAPDPMTLWVHCHDVGRSAGDDVDAQWRNTRVYRSTDGGQTWSDADGQLPPRVWSLTASSPLTAYAEVFDEDEGGDHTEGLYATYDGGQTWNRQFAGNASVEVLPTGGAVAMVSREDDVVELWMSTDGVTWSEVARTP